MTSPASLRRRMADHAALWCALAIWLALGAPAAAQTGPFSAASPPAQTGGQRLNIGTANPTGTASTTAVYMGLGVAGATSTDVVKPGGSGTYLVTIEGNVANGTLADGCVVEALYNTGTPAANGTSVSGTGATVIATLGTMTQEVATDASYFSVSGVLTLSPQTEVLGYIDLGLNAVTGGTCTVKSVTVVIAEL